MNEIDVIRSGLENIRLLGDRIPISIVEPFEEEIRVLDDDQRLDDHSLEEFFDKTFFYLRGI